MVAGMVSHKGYFRGLRPVGEAARVPSNPKGFFEDVEVNRINDAIIGLNGGVLPISASCLWFGGRRPAAGGWLVSMDPRITYRSTWTIDRRIRKVAGSGHSY